MKGLSIIITAHDEGLLAHKTMLSLFRAIGYLPKSVKYEIIIHLDAPDQPTREYFNRYRKDARFQILENTFHDVGLSRNYCIKQAKYDSLFISDADDLISGRFFSDGLELLKKNPDLIYHPQYVLSFGELSELCVCSDAESVQEAAFKLFSQNLWSSTLLANRDVLIKNPYYANCDGFGFEDYDFNIQTISHGILHKVVPNSILFYLRKENGLSVRTSRNYPVQHSAEIFEPSRFWKYNIPGAIDVDETGKSFRAKLLNAYCFLRNRRFSNRIITPFATVAKKITGRRLTRSARDYFSEQFMEEWRAIGEISNQAYPTASVIAKMSILIPGQKVGPSIAYSKICRTIHHHPDYLFCVPWLIAGGADKVVINYARAIKELNPSAKISVLATLAVKSIWADRLPYGVDFIDFGNATENLTYEERDLVFSRLIIQLACRDIYINNSELTYDWCFYHSQYVKKHHRVFPSLYCRDPRSDNSGGFFDYADPYAVRIAPLITRIFTDNSSIVDRLVENQGFNRSLFEVHYQPIEPAVSKKVSKLSETDGVKHILWASRVVQQKNPELIIEIAKRLDPTKYHIDVYGHCDFGYNPAIFRNISALTYHGGFNGFASLNSGQYDALLYTSIDDGLPNILLEAAAEGLPIIASDSGGISNLITNRKTGILVSSMSPDDYVKAITELCNDSSLAASCTKNAQKLLLSRHSWSSFLKSVQKSFQQPKKEKSPRIQIFISVHKPARLPQDNLFAPIELGVANRESPLFTNLIYDNTGDNISQLNPRFCELTAQYWAWKNTKADYYGFFHYRRYLDFHGGHKLDAWENVLADQIDDEFTSEYGLNEDTMRPLIESADLILPEQKTVTKHPTSSHTMREQFLDSKELHAKDLDVLFSVIADKCPEFLPYAEKYFNGSSAYECNMFIMKRPLFEEYCMWLFDILFECDRRIDYTGYSVEAMRTPGHLAERLLGIYVSYLKDTRPNLKVRELPTILVLNTSGQGKGAKSAQKGIKTSTRNFAKKVLPSSTRRGKIVRKVIHRRKVSHG